MGETLGATNAEKEWPKEEENRFEILSHAAQDLRYFPVLGEGIIQKCHNDVECTYIHNNYKHWEADFYIARSIRSMTWGTLAHVLYSRLISSLLPCLERGSSLLQAADIPLDSEFYTTAFIRKAHLTREQDIFTRVGAAFLLGASEALFQEIDVDSNHFYKPLLRQVEQTFELNKEERHKRDERRSKMSASYTNSKPKPLDNWREQWRTGMIDNLNTGRRVLEMERRTRVRGETRARKLATKALSNLEVLNWLSSINIETFNVVLDDTHRLGGMRATKADDPAPCSYVHPSFGEGPWSVRRFCAGQYVLRSPFSGERSDANRFFQLMGLPCDQGAFDPSLALLAISKKLITELE